MLLHMWRRLFTGCSTSVQLDVLSSREQQSSPLHEELPVQLDTKESTSATRCRAASLREQATARRPGLPLKSQDVPPLLCLRPVGCLLHRCDGFISRVEASRAAQQSQWPWKKTPQGELKKTKKPELSRERNISGQRCCHNASAHMRRHKHAHGSLFLPLHVNHDWFRDCIWETSLCACLPWCICLYIKTTAALREAADQVSCILIAEGCRLLCLQPTRPSDHPPPPHLD